MQLQLFILITIWSMNLSNTQFIGFDPISIQRYINSFNPGNFFPENFAPRIQNPLEAFIQNKQQQVTNNCNCDKSNEPNSPTQSNNPPKDNNNLHKINLQRDVTNNNPQSMLGTRSNQPTNEQMDNNFGSKMDNSPVTKQPKSEINREVTQKPKVIEPSKETFSTNLFQNIAPQNYNKNIIYSPLSLELLLTFVTIGSRGETASELKNALHLPLNNEQIVSQTYDKLQKQQYANDNKLIMANKMYCADNLEPEQNIRRLGSYLQTEFEQVPFQQPQQTSAKINNWVSHKTQNRIQNLINPNDINEQTQAILVNAIYFKAEWAIEFSTSDTKPERFQNIDGRNTQVDMMYNEEVFNYGEFPEIGSKVLELPYKNANISMMIILPNNPNNLMAVENAMNNVDLTKLSQQLEPMSVNVRLPRFKFGCELDMVEPLQQLGIQQLFTNNADMSGFFTKNLPKVSKVVHKAVLEVNEAGSEAAAASFNKLIPLSLPPRTILFTVDHPFIFAIRGPNTVYFIGHVVYM